MLEHPFSVGPIFYCDDTNKVVRQDEPKDDQTVSLSIPFYVSPKTLKIEDTKWIHSQRMPSFSLVEAPIDCIINGRTVSLPGQVRF